MHFGFDRDCAKAKRHMQALLDKSDVLVLPPDLQAHLDRCTACRNEWIELQHYDHLLQAGRTEIPDAGDLLTAFHARLAAETAAPSKKRMLWVGIGSASAAALVLFGIAHTMVLKLQSSAPILKTLSRTAVPLNKQSVTPWPNPVVALSQPAPTYSDLQLSNSQKTLPSWQVRLQTKHIAKLRTSLPKLASSPAIALKNVKASFAPSASVNADWMAARNILQRTVTTASEPLLPRADEGMDNGRMAMSHGAGFNEDSLRQEVPMLKSTMAVEAPHELMADIKTPVRLHVVDPQRGFASSLQITPVWQEQGAVVNISFSETPLKGKGE